MQSRGDSDDGDLQHERSTTSRAHGLVEGPALKLTETHDGILLVDGQVTEDE